MFYRYLTEKKLKHESWFLYYPEEGNTRGAPTQLLRFGFKHFRIEHDSFDSNLFSGESSSDLRRRRCFTRGSAPTPASTARSSRDTGMCILLNLPLSEPLFYELMIPIIMQQVERVPSRRGVRGQPLPEQLERGVRGGRVAAGAGNIVILI